MIPASDPAALPGETRALAGALLAGGEPAAVGRLAVVQGPDRGERLPLWHGAVLGRGRGVELRLGDPRASRRHARFTVRGAEVWVEDLASKNGLTVNGQALAAEGRPLRAGDVLALGGSVLVLDPAERGPGQPEEAPPAPAAGAEEEARPRRTMLAAAALLAAAAALALAAG